MERIEERISDGRVLELIGRVSAVKTLSKGWSDGRRREGHRKER